MALRAVLWDMDGTMVDSERLWAQTTFWLSEQMGRRLRPEQQQLTVGASSTKTIRFCAENAGIPDDALDVEYWRNLMFRDISERLRHDLQVYPGVRELLAAVQDAGLRNVVATNTYRVVAQSAIDAVGRDFFHATVCGDEVENPKPAADIYLRAAALADATPAETLVFEDSLNGMRAAVAAGCVTIGVPEHSDMPIPNGVRLLEDVAGARSFAGIEVADLQCWHRQVGDGSANSM